MSDRQALFKAAKAQRGSSAALSKEQLKALRAQKAKQVAEAETAIRQEAESKRRHEAARSLATDQASRLPPRPVNSSMGPPASRPAAQPRTAAISVGSAPNIGLRRTDSQKTNVGRNQSVAPEPAGQSNASSGAVRSEVQEVIPQQNEERSISSLPSNFFDQPENSGDQQAGRQASADTAERIGSNAEVHSEVASALARGSSVEAISARTRLPPDFFEAAGSTEGEPVPQEGERSNSSAQIGEALPVSALPRGFFANKDADARARGVVPVRKSKEEEYQDFMATIAPDVKNAEAAEEADAVEAAADKAAREAYEQKLRLDRISMLSRGERNLPDVRGVIYEGVELPDITIPGASERNRKRRRGQGQSNEGSGDHVSSDEDLEGELDWRSKTL